MKCNHKWVSVGTSRYCVKCGADFYEEQRKDAERAETKAKKRTAQSVKKTAENEGETHDEL